MRQDIKAFTSLVERLLKALSSSAHSRNQLARSLKRSSLLEAASPKLSSNQYPARVLKKVDLKYPCLPWRISAVSTLQPGLKALAAALMRVRFTYVL